MSTTSTIFLNLRTYINKKPSTSGFRSSPEYIYEKKMDMNKSDQESYSNNHLFLLIGILGKIQEC
jgi:hypothetical protein